MRIRNNKVQLNKQRSIKEKILVWVHVNILRGSFKEVDSIKPDARYK